MAECDFDSLVGGARHHARAGKHCVVNRVCADESTPFVEFDINNNKVMDVVEMFTY
jgi:hypothetical protein